MQTVFLLYLFNIQGSREFYRVRDVFTYIFWNVDLIIFVSVGVALKQLTCFFTQLKENDEEEYGSSTSEEA